MSKVLLVDDIPEYVAMMNLLLPDGLRGDSAFSYEQALEKLSQSKYDLAIVDIRLKDEDEGNKDGLKILSWMRENSRDTKVIMISAYQGFEFRIEALAMGALFFLEKPIHPESFREAIIKALTGKL